jgi:hypothetical protein
VLGIGAFHPEIILLEREAVPRPPSSTEVKNVFSLRYAALAILKPSVLVVTSKSGSRLVVCGTWFARGCHM